MADIYFFSVSESFAKNRDKTIKKIVFIDKAIADYRKGLFLSLKRQGYSIALISRLNEIDVKLLAVATDENYTLGRSEKIGLDFLVLRYLKVSKPSIVVSGDLGLRTLLALIHCKVNHRPLVVWARLTEYSERNRNFLRRFLRKIIIPNATAIIVNSLSGANYCKKFKPKKVVIIHQASSNSIPKLRSNGDHKVANERIWLYIGRLIPEKGLSDFLKVLAQYHNPGIHIKVIGDGPERTKLENICEDLGIQAQFLGWMGAEDMAVHIDEAECLLFPTLCDEWGLVVNEALARGLPILGSIFSGAVEELSRNNNIGFTFNPHVSAQVMRSIELMDKLTPDERNKLSSECRGVYFDENLDVEEMSSSFNLLFNSLS